MKKGIIYVCSLVMLFALSTPATAAVINNWTLDLTGVDGINVAISGINKLTYTGSANIVIADTNNNGFWDKGELASVTGNYYANAFLGAGPLNNFGLTQDWELTFAFSTQLINTNVGLQNINFSHLPGGFLDVYADKLKADPSDTGGLNFTDGVKIASFVPVAGPGGSYTYATQNGDDALKFLLSSGLSDVFLDASGKDLTGLEDLMYAINFSHFKYESGTPTEFTVAENGQTQLGVVPEPGTFLLLGAGLLGLGIVSRRRK